MSNFLAGSAPTPGSSLTAGLTAGLPIVGQLQAAFGGGQSFGTISVTNGRLAVYTLSIRAPGSLLPYSTYTFPISPASITKRYTAMSNKYDTAGPSTVNGVQRSIDVYGNSPVTYIIEGTTGWKLHATDGYTANGVDSILNLQEMLNLYASQNTAQAAANQPLYTLEFYDYFTGDYWQVEPMGPQEVRQTKDRPLILFYSFRLEGVVQLNNPITQLIDTLSGFLNNPAPQILGALGSTIGSTLSNYASQTPGAASLFGG